MIREVVLVPGLWMPAAAFTLLASRLARHGYAARLFPYRGRSPFEANVECLARFAREHLAGRAAHFVGHSLGGLLILDTLNRHAEVAVASAVLLGSPVRGCYAGRRLRAAGVGRWMMGASGALWDERPAVWNRAPPLGVIAGTLSVGLGRALGRLPGPNDGVVRVAETPVEGMAARTLVRQAHSSLIVSGQVADLVARFMAQGRFE
jgi:pimeloyl-ACP methyl ester carboxylesterase